MKGLDSTQVDQLKEIAEYLYQQRQHQEISLEKIAKQTYIPQRILQALESAQLDILPEPVYIKGFIRRYADALGLDGVMISDAFDVEPASLAHTAPEMQPEPAVSASRPAPSRIEPQTEPQIERQSDRPSRPERSSKPGLSFLPWLGAGIAALTLGAIAFSLLNQPPKTAVVNPTTTDAPTTKSSGSSSAPSSIVAPSAGSPVQVDLNLTERSWLEVSVDGKVAYEGSLDKGEQRTWKAKKSISIVAGNAGAVVASFNQGEAKALGKAGDVVTVAFPTPEKLPSN
ncbi:helix-turn-helix domain-containing protein [Phormidium sp. CLA17]|uniref:helix-turn-helix domain-containing protein n=1 Tax=Leptolyngbya sp. Cla-17 TaxID=2803751 RepID=UPI0019340B64|nr:RodZ domain-containing protein [Leptolyngbya sp. Cla-17]MBM0740634.1 helix-turn-helix domain-containing protein [Leptolyngbya sp. Cla-17]